MDTLKLVLTVFVAHCIGLHQCSRQAVVNPLKSGRGALPGMNRQSVELQNGNWRRNFQLPDKVQIRLASPWIQKNQHSDGNPSQAGPTGKQRLLEHVLHHMGTLLQGLNSLWTPSSKVIGFCFWRTLVQLQNQIFARLPEIYILSAQQSSGWSRTDQQYQSERIEGELYVWNESWKEIVKIMVPRIKKSVKVRPKTISSEIIALRWKFPV